MRVNALIIDDFYSNPDEVREFALQQEFKVRGNYPGMRTEPFANEDIKQTIESIIHPFAGKITKWHTEYTGCFQYTTAYDRSWIHSDSWNDWAGVLYLTPNAPASAGTGIFRHKKTGLVSWDLKNKTEEETRNCEAIHEAQDYTKWEVLDNFGNVFNRLVMYRGDNFHQSMDYFGKDINDGRLFQVFFFNTEN
jgi:hypothetical protein